MPKAKKPLMIAFNETGGCLHFANQSYEVIYPTEKSQKYFKNLEYAKYRSWGSEQFIKNIADIEGFDLSKGWRETYIFIDSLIEKGEITEKIFPVLREAYEFEDTLQFISLISNSRASAYSLWKSVSTGAEHAMLLSDTGDLLKSKDLIDGKVVGKFTFRKQGSNQGVKLIKSEIKE